MEKIPPNKDILSDTEWEKIEERVGNAESKKRQAQKGGTEIFKSQFEETSPRILKKLLERKDALSREVEHILGEENSPERALINLRKENLIKALRQSRELEKKRAALLSEESEILNKKEAIEGGELEALNEIRVELREIAEAEEKLKNESPEAYFSLGLKELKTYKEQLGEGEDSIVETPYVKEKIEEVVTSLRAGQPVFVYGHLGTGKTRLAMHVAKNNFIGKPALVISGSKNITLSEFYGHQILSIESIDRGSIDQYVKEVEKKYEAWVKTHDTASEEDKNRAHDRILELYLIQFKSGTISKYFLGPVYRAMEEGRIVIIDEVNSIPHEILISLNHILTRRVGDIINVQQDSGREIKIREGFGVIMTGNLNQAQERYVDREDLDPAFLSRLAKVDYDYLPQNKEGSLEEKAGPSNELFNLLLAKMMDDKGNIEAPQEAIKKLWKLAEVARISQDVFAGREVDNAHYFKQAGSTRNIKYFLKETVISLRALDQIISSYKADGYKYELDYYIWKAIASGTVASDKAYLYQELKDRFGFFQNGWPQAPDYGTGGVVNSFDIKSPKNSSGKISFWGPRDVVQFAFGASPKRNKWPQVKVAKDQKEKETENIERLKSIADFEKKISGDLKGIL